MLLGPGSLDPVQPALEQQALLQGPLACLVLIGCADRAPLVPPHCRDSVPLESFVLSPVRASVQLVLYGRG